jgi:hypothetical protein
MTNKASNQPDDLWSVIAKGLAEAVKMVFSVFLFVFTSDSGKSSEERAETESSEESSGYKNFGFSHKTMRDEYDKE